MGLRALLRVRDKGGRARKAAKARGRGLSVESLEERTVLTLAFTFNILGTEGVAGTDIGTMMANLNTAGAVATSNITGAGVLDVEIDLKELDTGVLAETVNAEQSYSAFYTAGQYKLFETVAQREVETGIDQNDGQSFTQPDIVIWVSKSRITGVTPGGQTVSDKLWLDDTYVGNGPLPPAASLPQGQYDFITVMTHELLHGLGIARSPFRNTANAGYWTTRYENSVTFNGSAATFAGTIPLHSATDYAHLADPSDLMSFSLPPNTRRTPSSVDQDILRNLQWTNSLDHAQFALPMTTVSENAGSVQLTVTRISGEKAGWITYTTYDGTAHAGTDYPAAQGRVFFGLGQTTATITLAVNDDGLVNGPRDFNVTLGGPSSSNLVPADGGTITTRVMIVSNEKRPGRTVADDFDNDGKADFSTFGPNGAGVYGFNTLYSSQGYAASASTFFAMGGQYSNPTVADYDGDGRADYSVYALNGQGGYGWYWYSSATGVQSGAPAYGSVNYIPVTGDFDGDGKSDFSVYGMFSNLYGFATLLSSRNFDVNNQSGFNGYGYGFGSASAQPLAGDFDGDGKSDYSVYSPNGQGGYGWFWYSSLTGNQGGAFSYGYSGSRPVVGDFDGDGRSDFATYGANAFGVYGFATLLSSRNFDINNQSGFNFNGFGYGSSVAIPTVADYDGDGKFDYSLFAPQSTPGASGWTYIASTNTLQYGYYTGAQSSLPIAGPSITLYKKSRGLPY